MTEQELRPTQHTDGSRDPLRRAFQVLDWIAQSQHALHGVREIASALDMQPSTISRLLAQLAEHGVVRRDEKTGRYGLGLELVRLGTLAAAKLDLAAVARRHLVELTDASGESSYLGIYDRERRRMMRVDTIASPNPLQYVVAMNQWVDIVRGASGQAILAFLPPAELEAVTADGMAPFEDDLLRGIEQVRRLGYVCTRGQRTPGAVGIGSPIFDSRGQVVGDVFITIPDSRFNSESEANLGALVRAAAERTTADIAGRWMVDSSTQPATAETAEL